MAGDELFNELSIDGIGSFFSSMLNSNEFILMVLVISFWVLFYGIFTLALRKSPLVGGDASHLKLAKIISGTLSAIIVLSSLVLAPPEGIIEFAQRIAYRFNFIFAAILAIVIFMVFKGLLSSEDKKVQYYGGFFGLTMALYLFGSLAPKNGTAYYAKLLGLIGIIILLIVAGKYILTHFGFGGKSKGSGRGGDGGGKKEKTFDEEMDEIIDIDDEAEQEKKFKKKIQRDKNDLSERWDKSEKRSQIVTEKVEYFYTYMKSLLRRVKTDGEIVEEFASRHARGARRRPVDRSDVEREIEKILVSRELARVLSLAKSIVREVRLVEEEIDELDKYTPDPKTYKKKATRKIGEITGDLDKLERDIDKLEKDYSSLVGEAEREFGGDTINAEFRVSS